MISETLGRPVEHRTTTDYLIAVEALANNTAHIGFFGAEGYVQAHDKNPKIVPLVIPSGADGRLETAVYYSWLAVARGQESNYQENGVFKIDNIQGKRFAFVSAQSASGFRVPSASIVKYFSQQEQWKNLTAEELVEGGANRFFSEVQFGGSHQGSAASLLSGQVDVAAFCDVCVQNYKVIMDTLRDINQTMGITLLVNLHQVDVALHYAERIIGINRGQVIYDGPPQALSNAQIYEIYGSEAGELILDLKERYAA